MLVFIDESYDRATDLNPKSTFSAVLIEEHRSRALDAKLFELKRHFWRVQNSYEMELKGRLLLNSKALELPKNREFMGQFLSLFREIGAITFAVTQDGTFPLASKTDRLPNLYRALMWRVNSVMAERFVDQHAIFFFDGIDHKTNQKIAISFTNFMLKHRWGQSYRNILPTPFFCDSEVTPGVQMADVIAYCVNEWHKGQRGVLDDYYKQFRELTNDYADESEELLLRGFQKIKPERDAGFQFPEPVSEVVSIAAVAEQSVEANVKTEEGSAQKEKETGGQ